MSTSQEVYVVIGIVLHQYISIVRRRIIRNRRGVNGIVNRIDRYPIYFQVIIASFSAYGQIKTYCQGIAVACVEKLLCNHDRRRVVFVSGCISAIFRDVQCTGGFSVRCADMPFVRIGAVFQQPCCCICRIETASVWYVFRHHRSNILDSRECSHRIPVGTNGSHSECVACGIFQTAYASGVIGKVSHCVFFLFRCFVINDPSAVVLVRPSQID